MNTSELLGEAPDKRNTAKDDGPDPAKKLYKTAGLGGLLAFVAWLGQADSVPAGLGHFRTWVRDLRFDVVA